MCLTYVSISFKVLKEKEIHSFVDDNFKPYLIENILMSTSNALNGSSPSP